jgi:membrane protease subunit HflK
MNEPHDHSSDKPGLPKGSAPPPPEPMEDGESRALSEALRSSFGIVKIIMILLVVVFFGSGFFTVSSQERAIVLRFGRPIGVGEQQLLGQGAHWSFPYPIDEVVKIPFSQYQIVTSTAGWYATTPEMEATNSEPPPGPSLNPAADGYTLTADGNVIHVRATLRYRINNPLNYVLKFANASNLVQSALNNALFFASAHFKADQALRLDKLGFKEKISARVQQLADDQQLGITVEQMEVTAIPPRYVRPNFEAVLSAEVERRQTNEVAQGYANRIRATAEGEASAIINAGETERTRLLQALEAETKYFTSQLPYYRSNPELFMARLRTETLARLMTNTAVEKFPILRQANGKPYELRVQLSREPQRPAQLQP